MTHAVDLDREQGPPRVQNKSLPPETLLGFVEDVFVLGVAQGQDVLAVALADHEFEFVISGVDSDKRDGGVVVFPRGNLAFPFTEVKIVALSLVITLS